MSYDRMMGKKTCAECGRQFEAPTYVDVLFCGANCEKMAKKKRISKTCPVCRNDFLTNRKEIVYCSKACVSNGKILVRRKYRKEYSKRPEVKARQEKYMRAYRRRRRL